MTNDELNRMHRVADQMTTCHSILRDRFGRRAVTLDVAILSLSVVLTAVAFLDPKLVEGTAIFGISPQIAIGWAGCLTFVLSLVQLRVDWKQKSDRHDQAAKAFSAIKLELGNAIARGDIPDAEFDRLVRSYQAVGDRHTAIPEKLFNRLKQRHLQKVEVSKLLSKYPGTSIWVLRSRLWIQDTWRAFHDAP